MYVPTHPLCQECAKEFKDSDLVAECIAARPCDNVVHRECADKLGGWHCLWMCAECDQKNRKVDYDMMVRCSLRVLLLYEYGNLYKLNSLSELE